MMKCRVWDTEHKKMIKWEDLKFDKDEGEDKVCFYEQVDRSSWNGTDNYIPLWYLGNLDDDMQAIYQGDILDCVCGKGDIDDIRGQFHKTIVLRTWEDCIDFMFELGHD